MSIKKVRRGICFFLKNATLGIDQPLCRDCFKKTDKMLQSRIVTFREQSAAYRAVISKAKKEPKEEEEEDVENENKEETGVDDEEVSIFHYLRKVTFFFSGSLVS